MEICLNASPMLEAMLPDRMPDHTKTYCPSAYNLIHHRNGRIYLYNLLTRRLACVSEAELQLLQSAAISGDDKLAAPLIAKRFLVLADTNEADHYVQLYSTMDIFESAAETGKTFYHILPTTGCNARCFYCFEHGVKIENMNRETADAVVDYIIRTHAPGQTIKLSWFGGEPLLRVNIIDRICRGIADAGVDFHSIITTNGSLWTPELIQKAKTLWKLSKVQITMDGVGEEHERRKAYVSLPDSYNITVQNIDRLVKADIAVIVRLNMDVDNIESIEQFYDWMKTRYTTADRIAFDPAILFEELLAWDANRSTAEQTRLRDAWLALRNRMLADGFYRPKPLENSLIRAHCMANSGTSVTVLPDGTLSFCQAGCEEGYYGDIYRGVTKPELVKKWRSCTDIREMCRNCPYLPQCTGFSQCPTQQSDCRRAMADIVNMRLYKTVKNYEEQ